jgi:hypothetical protein
MAKKKENKKSVKEVVEKKPPEMQSPGHYLRENGVLYLNDKFDKDTISPRS